MKQRSEREKQNGGEETTAKQDHLTFIDSSSAVQVGTRRVRRRWNPHRGLRIVVRWHIRQNRFFWHDCRNVVCVVSIAIHKISSLPAYPGDGRSKWQADKDRTVHLIGLRDLEIEPFASLLEIRPIKNYGCIDPPSGL